MAFFGAKGVVEATTVALQHACEWINLAWKANGDAQQIDQASKEFCHMLVNIAMAALGVLGMKSNVSSATRYLKAAEGVSFMPPSLMMEVAGTGQVVLVFGADAKAMAVAALDKTPSGAIAGVTNRAKAKEPPSDGNPVDGQSAEQQVTKRPLKDAELEKLLEELPNWDSIKEFVGRPIPKPGTPEFTALKVKLKQAGYQLEVLKEFKQPYRLKRLREGQERRARGAHGDGRGDDRPTRRQDQPLSVYSRYRKQLSRLR